VPQGDDDSRGSLPRRAPRVVEEGRTRLQPRMGRRARLASASPGVARLVLRGHGRRAPALGKVGTLPARRYARRVVIQAHVQRMTGNGAKAAALHLAYIERDGAGKDGSPAVLYGPDGPVPRARFEQPRVGESHQFRFMVSPEDGHALDLQDYVRQWMRRVERELGRSLEWAAANHYDTEHPHAHVVVRGVDLHGRRVLMSRQYISHGMRGTAQELANEFLGPRLESEIQRTREREVIQERLTALDRELNRCATDDRVDADAVRARSRDDREAQHLFDRLEHLERLGVAGRVSSGRWKLTPGWQKDLRDLGERGDIVKQLHRAMRAGDPERFYTVRPGQGLPDGRGGVDERAMVGRVAAKGLEDESKGIWYAVLETETGAAYHVRLSAWQAEVTRTGDLVSFGTKRDVAVRPVDRHIAEVAARDGVYVLAGDGGREGEARSAAARLRELERLGMVTARSQSVWNVPPDLLERLETRHRDQRASYRLSMQPARLSLDAQVHHQGPVWLDSVDPATLTRQGFGAEVLAAAERRQQALHELGIRADDPQRVAKLRDLEQRAVGREIERQTGWTLVEPTPRGFRGRLHPLPEGGAPYLAVSDGQRFILVPASREARSSVGRIVDVSRDAAGRVLVVPDSPARAAERQELARRAAGETLARTTGRTFLESAPANFRGWVQAGPAAMPYLEVSDGVRFILIPSSPEARALSGRTVDVSRDAQGRVGLRPRDRDHDLGR
jgi:type IV secretory pathway VirD2 relaxase